MSITKTLSSPSQLQTMNNEENIHIHTYNGEPVSFDFDLRSGSHMVNATQMIKGYNKWLEEQASPESPKRLDNFMRLKQTKEFIQELETVLKSDTSDVRYHPVIKAVRGGKYELRGTWVHELLALKIAAWLSPRFEIWVFQTIRDLFRNGDVQLQHEQIMRDAKKEQWFLEKSRNNAEELANLLNTVLEEREKQIRQLKK